MSLQFPFNAVPYNSTDRNNNNNNPRGINPSYQYKKKRVIWLNTNYATTNIKSGTTYYEFSFDIPPFHLYNQTKLSVASYISNEDNAKPIIIKVKNLLCDAGSTYSNDKESYPILYVNHQKIAGFLTNDKMSLTLVPQLISNITIKINDSFTARDNGFTIAANGVGHFIICLLLEDEDLIADNIVSPYK